MDALQTSFLEAATFTLPCTDLHIAQVLERAKQYRPMGAGIGIDVNGMKAIEAIDPSLRKWFNAEGLNLKSTIINDHKGECHGQVVTSCTSPQNV